MFANNTQNSKEAVILVAGLCALLIKTKAMGFYFDYGHLSIVCKIPVDNAPFSP